MAILSTTEAVDYLCARSAQPGKRRPYSVPKLLAAVKAGTVPVFDRDGRGYQFSTAQLDAWLENRSAA